VIYQALFSIIFYPIAIFSRPERNKMGWCFEWFARTIGKVMGLAVPFTAPFRTMSNQLPLPTTKRTEMPSNIENAFCSIKQAGQWLAKWS